MTKDVYLYPTAPEPRDVILRPYGYIPVPPLNLINKALQYSKELRIEFLSFNFGITEPLTPKAIHSHQYLLVREFLMRGCRKAVKLVLNPYQRSNAYSVLVKATTEIFYYGYKPEIIAYHNDLLDKLIGTH